MKLNYRRTINIGLAFMGISAFWQIYDNIIPLILKNSFDFGETATGAIMAADNILAIVLLPLIGAWSDKIDTRIGKRTPFIIVGTLLSVIFMMLIPLADKIGSIGFFIAALGIVLVSMGIYRSPAVALMPDLTPPQLRSQGNAVINVMGALGAIYSLGMIQILVKHEERPDYTSLFLSVAGVMVIALIVLVCTIREKKLASVIAKEYPEFKKEEEQGGKISADVKKSLFFALAAVFFYYISYNGVTTAFSRYAQEVWGLMGGSFSTSLLVVAVAAFISYIPLGALAAKIGRKKTIAIGFAIMIFSFIVLTPYDHFHWTIYLWFAIIGVGGSAVGVNIFPVVVDMCSDGELGKYTGLYYTFSMAAQIVTPVLSGALLEHISYRTLFPYAAVFSILGLGTMYFVRHGDSKPSGKILESLDN